jgi:hypothetical protein
MREVVVVYDEGQILVWKGEDKAGELESFGHAGRIGAREGAGITHPGHPRIAAFEPFSIALRQMS